MFFPPARCVRHRWLLWHCKRYAPVILSDPVPNPMAHGPWVSVPSPAHSRNPNSSWKSWPDSNVLCSRGHHTTMAAKRRKFRRNARMASQGTNKPRRIRTGTRHRIILIRPSGPEVQFSINCPASWLEIQARLTPPHQHMLAKVHLEINSSETVEDEDDGPVFLV